jgi:hypothetical protein
MLFTMDRNNHVLSKYRVHAPPPPNTWDVDDDVMPPFHHPPYVPLYADKIGEAHLHSPSDPCLGHLLSSSPALAHALARSIIDSTCIRSDDTVLLHRLLRQVLDVESMDGEGTEEMNSDDELKRTPR